MTNKTPNLTSFITAILATMGLAVALLATATPASASSEAECMNIAPYGYIGERWNAAGGLPRYHRFYGCPTSPEFNVQNGVKQNFRNGQIG